MTWGAVFVLFFVSHQVGDFLFQTDWQAMHKRGGLGRDPVARRALFSHTTTYLIAFIPAFIWLASALHWRTLIIVFVIWLPHVIQDDGRAIQFYARKIKGLDPARSPFVMILLDQAFHMVELLGTALLVSALR